MTPERFCYPVISLVVKSKTLTGHILLQRRTKPEAPGLDDMYELPQGRLRENESIMECAERELNEETGLYGFVADTEISQTTAGSESLEWTSSATVVCERGFHSFLSICLVGSATGTARPSNESSDPRWHSRLEVMRLLKDGRIYPLNVPMLRSYYRL